MGVEGEGPGDPAAERALDNEIERADVRQFVAPDRTSRDRGEMGLGPVRRSRAEPEADTSFGSKAITEMLEVSPLWPVREWAISSSSWARGLHDSHRGSRSRLNGELPTTSRAAFHAPPPAAGPLV